MKTTIVNSVPVPPPVVVLELSERDAAILRLLSARDIAIPDAMRKYGYDGGVNPTYVEFQDFLGNLLKSLRLAGVKTFHDLETVRATPKVKVSS